MPLHFLKIPLLIIFCFWSAAAFAVTITGQVTDEAGKPLPFASVTVKGTGKGAVANNHGHYSLALDAGVYTLVCHHVGYQSEEKILPVTGTRLHLDFRLRPQNLFLPEVVIEALKKK